MRISVAAAARLAASCSLGLAIGLSAVYAQEGASSAAASRARYLGDLGIIPASREVAVEEFVNYHRHEVGRPKSGEAVHMDLRWVQSRIVSSQSAVLQIGLSTALANDRQNLKRVNLALVIDKSGSMAAADKMSRVKAALLTLVSQLRETDILSIVVFDTTASVLLPAQTLRDKERVRETIRSIEPGSSTNLHAGLMLGYQEARKKLLKDGANRVVILTDGIANSGVTDPKKIASDSQAANDDGIDLSTIGVGAQLNKDLLRDLAQSGRGLFHFVADTEDIQKVFLREFQSLVAPVARDPKLVVELGPDLRLEHVYGYEPKVVRNTVTFELDNMNSGLTQVVLMRLSPAPPSGRGTVKVRLSYYDLDLKKAVTKSENAHVDVLDESSAAKSTDSSVLKNLTIAELAQSIKDMAKFCEMNRFRDADKTLSQAVSAARERYPSMEDPDIKRTYEIAAKYQQTLGREREARGEVVQDDDPLSHIPNMIFNGNFEHGNSSFSSDIPYIAPSPNCLWGSYYTVVQSFCSPVQLHTNVPAKDFSAPKGGNVLFMNSGIHRSFTAWSMVVHCKARTKYRISFREIGLSGGPEWTNSYEIRVNGARSEPQLGGEGRYAEISFVWESGGSASAHVSIVRLPRSHPGGVVGIANIEMVEIR